MHFIPYCRVLVVHPSDRLAEWALWLIATAQHHKRVSYRILLDLEKIKFKIQSKISTEYVLL